MKALRLKDVTDEELRLPGTSGCAGCGADLALRLVSKATGRNTIMVNATGCMTVNVGMGATEFPFFHVAFENAASVASGIDAALRSMRIRDNLNLVCFAGDGGTADIGLQALSGAIERGHKFTYVCYDNESYMNTGGQKSGTTPWGAATGVTPTGVHWRKLQRSPFLRKELPLIIAAHGAPYVATASVAFPTDLIQKMDMALHTEGPSYVHIHSPCPSGWGYSEHLTVKIARLAVQTGIFNLFEVRNGKVILNSKRPSLTPIEEYIKIQSRFSHLADSDIKELQEWVNNRHSAICELAEISALRKTSIFPSTR